MNLAPLTSDSQNQNQIPTIEDINAHNESEIHDGIDGIVTPLPHRGSARHAHVITSSERASANGHAKKRVVPNKWKARRRAGEAVAEPGEECYLLNLPNDLLRLILTRLPPRTLLRVAATCQLLHTELEDESIWRQSYANRFLYDGAARSVQGQKDVEILAQGCLGTGGRGWKRESLSREAMIDRWIGSKAGTVVHTPPTGLIHSLSLSYPPFIPAAPRPLVVGKNHQTPTKAKSQSSSTTPSDNNLTENGAGPSTLTLQESPTPKMTHRQKYEALLAATTRPPPHVLSASLAVGGVVRSDPISAKVSKGYWGPGRDANLHLRPHLDPSAEPSAIHLPVRKQSHVLWGLKTGSCVHTTMQSRHHATHGGRASSRNVQSEFIDAHQGEITDIWMSDDYDAVDGDYQHRWITAGEDGRIKVWKLHPGSNRSGKPTPKDNAESIPASIECLFTSDVVKTTFPNRSDAVRRRQSGSPDAIALARLDVESDVACGVTKDGDLRLWIGVTGDNPKEVRVDVGAEEVKGGVRRMELEVRSAAGREEVVASVLIYHHRSSVVTRYDISPSGVERLTTFNTPTGSSIISIHPSIRPTPPIASTMKQNDSPLFTPSGSMSAASSSSQSLDLSLPAETLNKNNYGRFVIAGDEAGYVHIWSWDEVGQVKSGRNPIRSWEAMTGRITSLDISCGLIAVGSHDGYIKIFDPLPTPPKLLRTFHASRLTPGEQIVASTDEPDARYYTVNQIILDNDLVVASIGRKVFAWRAGSGKGRQGGKEMQGWKKSSVGKNEGKGTSRGVMMKALHHVAAEDHAEIKAEANSSNLTPTKLEAREMAAMQEMGLEDGDDALQYALMLSMNGGNGRVDVDEDGEGEGEGEMDEETREAIRQVEMFEREERELERVMELIRMSESRAGDA